jgi:tRNA threonylcarbamoyladenosine biosynthesis protein TsaB
VGDDMLLALDTATATASIAVYHLEDNTLLAEYTWQARRRHTQDLLATVDQVLQQVSVQRDQITALAVTTGPGSFTGVRIAISTVKGLALGLYPPPRVFGLPTLSVTAAPWLEPADASMPQASVCAYIQAGRGRYNWALFDPSDELRRPAAEDHGAGAAAEFETALAACAPRPIWLVGELDASLAAKAAEFDHVCVVRPVSSLRRAGQLAQLAARHLDQGAEDDLAALQPLYLRQP